MANAAVAVWMGVELLDLSFCISINSKLSRKLCTFCGRDILLTMDEMAPSLDAEIHNAVVLQL